MSQYNHSSRSIFNDLLLSILKQNQIKTITSLNISEQLEWYISEKIPGGLCEVVNRPMLLMSTPRQCPDHFATPTHATGT